MLFLCWLPHWQPSPWNGQKSFFTFKVVFISNIILPNLSNLPPEYKPLKLLVDCISSATLSQLISMSWWASDILAIKWYNNYNLCLYFQFRYTRKQDMTKYLVGGIRGERHFIIATWNPLQMRNWRWNGFGRELHFIRNVLRIRNPIAWIKPTLKIRLPKYGCPIESPLAIALLWRFWVFLFPFFLLDILASVRKRNITYKS